MSAILIIDLIRTAVTICLMTAGPLLVTALVVGVLVSFVQAVTQVQEQTLTFVPKFAAIALVGLALLPWFLGNLVTYISDMLRSLPSLTGS